MSAAEWLQHPALHYAIVAAGMIFCLVLFGSMKQEMRNLEKRLMSRQIASGEALAVLQARLDSLAEEMQQAEEQSAMLVPPAPARSGLNLSARSQALRMHRRGESPDQIASALGLPRNEVELLLKVQKILVEGL